MATVFVGVVTTSTVCSAVGMDDAEKRLLLSNVRAAVVVVVAVVKADS